MSYFRKLLKRLLPDIIPDVGWWKLDEGGSNGLTADSTSNANTGTLENLPTWTSGQGSNSPAAVLFNGTNQYISTALTNINYSSGTISWWMKPSSAYNSGSISKVLWSQNYGHNPYFGIELYTNGNFYGGWISSGGTDTRVVVAANTTLYPNGSWVFYTLTWSPSATTLFVNGAQVGINNTAAANSNVGSNFLIGAGIDISNGGNDGFFPGTMDDVRIYSRVLSGNEINTLYNNGAK